MLVEHHAAVSLIKCGTFTRLPIYIVEMYIGVLHHTTSYPKTPYDTIALLLFCVLYTVVESIYITADILLTAYQPMDEFMETAYAVISIPLKNYILLFVPLLIYTSLYK